MGGTEKEERCGRDREGRKVLEGQRRKKGMGGTVEKEERHWRDSREGRKVLEGQ